MSAKDPHNESDSLEVFFKKRLRDAELAPPEKTWGQLEGELDLMEKKKRRRVFFWFFFSGLLLVGGLVSVWFAYNTADKKNTAVAATKNKTGIKTAENKTIVAPIEN